MDASLGYGGFLLFMGAVGGSLDTLGHCEYRSGGDFVLVHFGIWGARPPDLESEAAAPKGKGQRCLGGCGCPCVDKYPHPRTTHECGNHLHSFLTDA